MLGALERVEWARSVADAEVRGECLEVEVETARIRMSGSNHKRVQCSVDGCNEVSSDPPRPMTRLRACNARAEETGVYDSLHIDDVTLHVAVQVRSPTDSQDLID